MKDKLKTTSFWFGVSGAVVLILDCLSRIIGIEVYSSTVQNIILSICSILITVGFITKRKVGDTVEVSKEELLDEIEDEMKK